MYRIVFEQHVRDGEEEAFIEHWQANSDVIQKFPGARGTGLFRNLGVPSVLYAFADWESKEARELATQAIGEVEGLAHKLRDHEQFVNRTVVVAELEIVGVSLPS
jgi:hypothetical protein